MIRLSIYWYDDILVSVRLPRIFWNSFVICGIKMKDKIVMLRSKILIITLSVCSMDKYFCSITVSAKFWNCSYFKVYKSWLRNVSKIKRFLSSFKINSCNFISISIEQDSTVDYLEFNEGFGFHRPHYIRCIFFNHKPNWRLCTIFERSSIDMRLALKQYSTNTRAVVSSFNSTWSRIKVQSSRY